MAACVERKKKLTRWRGFASTVMGTPVNASFSVYISFRATEVIGLLSCIHQSSNGFSAFLSPSQKQIKIILPKAGYEAL